LISPPRAQFVPSGEAPVEPWAGSFRFWMILVGLGLIATTVAPWAGGEGKLVFSWSMLTQDGVAQPFKVWPIVYGAGGFLCLLLGLIPVPVGIRGLAGVLLGAAAMILNFVVGPLPFAGGPSGVGGAWQGYVILGGMILTPAGLLVAAQYPRAMFGRLLAFLGALMLLAPMLIPVGGEIPIVSIFKRFGGGGGLGILDIWVPFSLLFPAVLGLIAIAKPVLATFGAWLLILTPVITALIARIIDPLVRGNGFSFEPFLREPIQLLILIPTFAFPLLLAYGLATLIGKVLED